jgi:formamidopyrimidine-DNA glycosylase
MPELPEVEVICRGLVPNLVGRTITAAIFSHQKMRLPLPAQQLSAWITGRKIKAVRRVAKFIVLDMDSSACLVVHLGMTGRLNFFPAGTAPAKHDHARWLLDNGLELRFHDTRRFGSIQVLAPGENPAEVFGELGPDPFRPEFNADYLAGQARGRALPVKNLLMDNRVVTGIGNIYASEILHVSGVNPATPAGHLSLQQWQKIVTNSRLILKAAIACGGTTISDYVNSRGEKGYFQTRLQVYGREGEACPICQKPIKKVRLGGRASYYCPGCQPEPDERKIVKKRR